MNYIPRTGLLAFIQLASHGTPKMNPCAITALIDRWRPETHTFHLPCGEMTVTLQDVSMILALPIAGEPVCLSTNTGGWRDLMICLLGKQPGIMKKSAGAPFSWIAENFVVCPLSYPRILKRCNNMLGPMFGMLLVVFFLG